MAKRTKENKTVLADELIIDMYWVRDEAAIRDTDKKYGKFLLRIAYNILHDMSDSEECQNDTYLGIWNAIPPERPDVFSIFISRIMRNLAIKKYKAKTRKKRVPSEMTLSMDEMEAYLHNDELPEDHYNAQEIGRLINGYLATLDERGQYIFIGRFYMGDKLETIAKELHVNVSTVHREIEKIKQGLKSYLERNGVYV